MTITLSESALELLRLHFADMRPRVDDANREAYRELGRAGFMEPLHSFTWGQEANYRLTKAGADLRSVIIAPSNLIPSL